MSFLMEEGAKLQREAWSEMKETVADNFVNNPLQTYIATKNKKCTL
jgi:hypothetical protein